MPECQPHHFAADCPSRILFDQIADKWSMMVLAVLDDGPLRFNAIKRLLEGVTQRALTQCLRRLERNGLISRRVITDSPVAVEYEMTALGRSLQAPFKALYGWSVDHMDQVEAARATFDARLAACAVAV
jgi:DNA-binding HxlR family transcriptional regulator